jgi:hypothetical protein
VLHGLPRKATICGKRAFKRLVICLSELFSRILADKELDRVNRDLIALSLHYAARGDQMGCLNITTFCENSFLSKESNK